MVNDVDKGVIARIRKLYKEDGNAQRLFDWVAEMQRDATATTIDRWVTHLGISRFEAVALARSLEAAGCGDFVVGRRGQKSRFAWSYSRVSLGQAAAGEDDKIEQPIDPVSELEEDAEEREAATMALPSSGADISSLRLTIAEAKAALALSLGVPITAIEIVIRS